MPLPRRSSTPEPGGDARRRPRAWAPRYGCGTPGVTYDLAVYRTAPGSYRVWFGRVPADLSVDVLNAYERRVRCAGRYHRVVAVTQGPLFRIVVDGVRPLGRPRRRGHRPGRMARVRGEILVRPGDKVAEGDPVAVLESMKMESTVTAPYPGEVAGIDVVPNAQVSAGAPLLRIRATEPASLPVEEPGEVDLEGLEIRPVPGTPPCDRVFGSLRNYLLGYDLDPATLKRLLVEQRRLGEVSPRMTPACCAARTRCSTCSPRWAGSTGRRPRPSRTTPSWRPARRSTCSPTYSGWTRTRPGLPQAYRGLLEAALERYGITGLDRTPQLESAVVWMFRSFSRVGELAPVVVSILERRLRAGAVLQPLADAEMRGRLDRLIASAQGRQQGIADLARDVRFRYFDEPVLEALVAAEYEKTEQRLDALGADPCGPDRARFIDRLVRSPQPQRGALLRRWLGTADADMRATLLEIYARRYYRIRELRDLHVDQRGDDILCASDYDWENKHIHLVVAYTALDGLPEAARAVAAHLEHEPTDRQVVVDLATWRDGPRIRWTSWPRRSRSCSAAATSAARRGGST